MKVYERKNRNKISREVHKKAPRYSLPRWFFYPTGVVPPYGAGEEKYSLRYFVFLVAEE